jgi:hypothetical protein
MAPKIVSAVDSGNLAASFYSLHAGAVEMLKRPLVQKAVSRAKTDSRWVAEERERCEERRMHFIKAYAPWLSPRFVQFLSESSQALDLDKETPTLARAAAYITELEGRLDGIANGGERSALARELRALLPAAKERLQKLRADVQAIAERANHYADAMEYGFLLVEGRKLLSIGYDGVTGELYNACYDLLASEARMASFLAVAKGDIPQESWFRLDRMHVLVKGRACLVSWTGTMFEYMMPALWMRAYPNTLITRSLESAVRIQRDHVRKIPWGISESGYAKTDAAGRYGYQAWGIPQLALKYGADDGPVISPYSTFLALEFLRDDAIDNLRRMEKMGWLGDYGLYEAADYIEGGEARMVRSWMAHHQGMSLLALTNLLRDDAFQRWFHANAMVRAAELLLHEKPLSKESERNLEEPEKAKRRPAQDEEDEAQPQPA